MFSNCDGRNVENDFTNKLHILQHCYSVNFHWTMFNKTNIQMNR